MSSREKVQIDLQVWQDTLAFWKAESDRYVGTIQQMSELHGNREHDLERQIAKLKVENTLLKNCLCEDCRVKRNTKKQIKVEGKGLQL